MRQFMIFLKKELTEIFKTRRFIAIASVFLFFAFTSPLTAKFIKELLDSLAPGTSGMLPDPVYTDSYLQFIKNLSQIGFITLLLAFAGIVSEEKNRGTVMIIMTKGLSRFSFIISKLVAAILVYTSVYIVSVGVCFIYTYGLFSDRFTNPAVIPAMGVFWVLGVFAIALSHFFSSWLYSYKMSAIMGVVGFLLLAILASLPKYGPYTPFGLVNKAGEMVLAGKVDNSFIAPVLICLGLVIVLASASVLIFKRQEIPNPNN